MENLEYFIECVKNYTCLWDNTCDEYKMPDIRVAAWEDIVKECGLSDVREAKTIWKKLRDGHRQALTRTRPRQEKTWKYYKHMDFITPFMTNRDSSGNYITILEMPDTEKSDHDETIDIQKRFKREKPMKRRSSEVIEYLEIDERDTLKKKTHNDALKSFFDAMYEMSKDLPEVALLKIQRDVFNSVMKAKEQSVESDYKIWTAPCDGAQKKWTRTRSNSTLSQSDG